MTRHFLDVDDLEADELVAVLDRADALKMQRQWLSDLTGSSVALVFEKPSTRTRVSFDVAVRELGGHPVILSAGDLQLGRGETVQDTARVLSGFVQAVVIRTFAHDRLRALAAAAAVPVVNALSDKSHPCQALADLQTLRAHLGGLAGRTVAYLGDGNNVAHSLLVAGAMVGMRVVVASPHGHQPAPEIVASARAHAERSGGSIEVTDDPMAAAKAADALYTDVWTSMGQEAEQTARAAALAPYRIDAEALAAAAPGAVVLHCLPAHRGQEISADVLDGPQSVVWEQAANRLPTAKAVLLHLLGCP